MTRLVVRAMTYLSEAGGPGSGQPQLILFRGSRIHPPCIQVAGGKDGICVGTTLDYTYSPANVYVVAMVEQELAGTFLGNCSWACVLDFWATWWNRFTTPHGRVACATLALIAGGAADTDELLSARPLNPIHNVGGAGQLVEFSGDGGLYRARFAQHP